VRFLFIGDIVGKPGRTIVRQSVPGLIERENLDLVVANAENAAGGSGLTPVMAEELFAAGVDLITLGDHVYKRKEIIPLLERDGRIVRPCNFPATAPGITLAKATARDGTHVAVFCALGRVFTRPVDCPFTAAEEVLKRIGEESQVTLLDLHAEATSDMQAMGRYLDGRVTAVLGTHTHVATADEQVFPGGTAFQCDVGMTGPHDSILGRRTDRVLETTLTFRPTAFDVAKGDVRLCGTVVDADPATGKATAIRRLVVRESDIAEM
jgi:metallophosphoesterase (TIGR00282 family)